jgi:aryl-alcohol dehydrogenase-like predicted oxidoreductase
MQYSILGNTGLVVSRLAFGAMAFTAGKKEIARFFDCLKVFCFVTTPPAGILAGC